MKAMVIKTDSNNVYSKEIIGEVRDLLPCYLDAYYNFDVKDKSWKNRDDGYCIRKKYVRLIEDEQMYY